MAQIFRVHPETPQRRLIEQAVALIRQGAVVIYPTDTAYAMGCHVGDKSALDRIRQIRCLDKSHHFTLLCRDLSELGSYAEVNNSAYRFIKRLTPGPYTFILKATKQVPRRLMHVKHKTIGLRVPDHSVVASLLESLGEPLLNTSLTLPGEDFPLIDPDDIQDRLGDRVDLILDAGACGMDLTTIVDVVDQPTLIRQGKGELEL